MVLVLFLVGILLLLSVIIVLFLVSTLRLDIEKIQIDSIKKKDILIYIQFYLFGKWKWIQTRIDDEKIDKWNIENKLQTMDLKKIKSKIHLKQGSWKEFKNLQLEVEEFHLKAGIGTMDVKLTTILNFLFILMVSILLPRGIKQYESKKYNYEIHPIYTNENMVKIDLSCIIRIKIVHIISTIYVLSKKGRVKKHERTSNRRTYGYSYE